LWLSSFSVRELLLPSNAAAFGKFLPCRTTGHRRMGGKAQGAFRAFSCNLFRPEDSYILIRGQSRFQARRIAVGAAIFRI
jgi:hypothetical protein